MHLDGKFRKTLPKHVQRIDSNKRYVHNMEQKVKK